MNLSKQSRALLDISAREMQILNALGSHNRSLTPTRIASKTKIPRTTAHFLLKKLRAQGLVNIIRVNNHWEWQQTQSQNLQTIIRTLATDIGLSAGKNTVIQERGIESLQKIYNTILNLNDTDRIYSIQGAGAIKQELFKLSTQYLQEFHKKIKKRKIVIEGVVAQSALSSLQTMTSEQIESHYGRATIIYVVPDSWISFDSEIIVRGNYALIVNPKTEHFVVLQSNWIADAFKTLVQTIGKTAKIIDLNQYLKQLLEKK